MNPDAADEATYVTLRLSKGIMKMGQHAVANRAEERAVATLRRLHEAYPDRVVHAFHYAEGEAQRAATAYGLHWLEDERKWLEKAVRMREWVVSSASSIGRPSEHLGHIS